MKILFISLFMFSSLSFALPPSAEQVKEALGAKNAIAFWTNSIVKGNLPNLTCTQADIEDANLCKSGGAYVVLDQKWKTKVYVYTCIDNKGVEGLVDCGEL
ncbi:hypothetical protein N9N67_02590 [Bacteriovoracaceae bacterium]|nr:hypothetical protein [Bacteriovoracaceae bacterium]